MVDSSDSITRSYTYGHISVSNQPVTVRLWTVGGNRRMLLEGHANGCTVKEAGWFCEEVDIQLPGVRAA